MVIPTPAMSLLGRMKIVMVRCVGVVWGVTLKNTMVATLLDWLIVHVYCVGG